MAIKRLALVFSGVLALSAAGTLQAAEPPVIKTAETLSPISVASRTGLPIIKFRQAGTVLVNQDKIGSMEFGWLCGGTQPIIWNDGLQKMVLTTFERYTNKELDAAGYPGPKKQDSVFDTETKNSEVGLEVGALLKEMSWYSCWEGNNSAKGGLHITVKWQLFNPKLQKVVYSVETEGSYTLKEKQAILPYEFVGGAIASAARNLLSTQGFVDAVAAPLDAQAATTSADAKYSFTNPVPPKGGVAKNNTLLRAAVVTIESGSGSGSGFYINSDGYILTDRHVVGDSKFLKIRTATGRELPGEVLAIDTNRDVALVKTEKTPFDPLSVRLDDAAVGDEVYAVGSPLGDQFNGSVTKGVLSGYRTIENLRYVQSDVAVLPGNSGGPLLDAQGRVLGLTVLAVAMPGAHGGNLNLFVPIGEALTKLSVQMK